MNLRSLPRLGAFVAVCLLAADPLAAQIRSRTTGVKPGGQQAAPAPQVSPDALGFFLDPAADNADAASFANFETPHVAPIAVATLGSGPSAHDWLLVCNTPDNSVEIYDASPPFQFVQRVPVGLGPVTVRWNAAVSRFFTCNFDGDSVTRVRFELVFGQPVATVERTDRVGDEPSDIAFMAGNTVAVVSLNSRSAVTFRDVSDMTVPVVSEFILETPNPNLPGTTLAVKMPRQIEIGADGRFFALNFLGGITHPAMPLARQCDFDVYWTDPGLSPQTVRVPGLGTINQAFALNAQRNRMFVVGTLAGHLDAAGVQAVSQLPTGFAKSCMWVIDATPGQTPVVQPFAQTGVVGGPLLQSIDFNRDLAQPGVVPVSPASLGLAQPSAVLVRENPVGPEGVGQVIVAFQHSDNVAILEPSNSAPGGWVLSRVAIPVPVSAHGYSISGPSGLAQSAAAGLVYVMNRFSDSVAVINPQTKALVGQFLLNNDPTPLVINRGREFLYSTRHSGNGFVSCASCHVQGRTDGLAWDLGGTSVGPAIPPQFIDNLTWNLVTTPNFPSEKGPLVTQTLQGLVNSRVHSKSSFLFTNAPYHWRGDKEGFTKFNEAFHNLQGKPNIGIPSEPLGVTEGQMRDYEAFVFTIEHPANPEQPLARVPTGALGVDPNDPFSSSGGKRGLQLYHNVVSVDVRSCVDCHALPDGSSNTATLAFQIVKTLTGGQQRQPFESPNLRGLRQREATLHTDFQFASTRFVKDTGMLHAGLPNFLGVDFSINTFVHTNFTSDMPGTPAQQAQLIADVVEFTRSLDTGTAPIVGFPYTLAPEIPGQDNFVLAFLESQVLEGNAGLAAYARQNGVEKGYWFDITANPPAWREEGTSNLIPRSQLSVIASGTGNVVTAQATPLLEERRVASLSGSPTPLPGALKVPTNIVLEAMAPTTYYTDVTRFNGNLHWPNPTPGTTMWSLRQLQNAVVGPNYGIPVMRHEPPRRFRVTGDGIRPGARMALVMQTYQPADPYHLLVMDLVPTQHFSGGRRVWETVQELDAHQTLALLNGGPFRAEVANILARNAQANPALLDPGQYNRYLPIVWNGDQNQSFWPYGLTWQTLRVQDGR